MPPRFADYLTAIDRKLQIGLYHREQLVPLLDLPADPEASMPPVAIQAHFEGVLRAPVAMLDQLVAGVADVTPKMPQPHHANTTDVCARLRGSDSESALKLAGLLGSYQRDPLLCDARSLRNRATHSFYEKYIDNHGWQVEEPRYLADGCSPWVGERYVGPYTAALLELAARIRRSAAETARLLADMGCSMR